MCNGSHSHSTPPPSGKGFKNASVGFQARLDQVWPLARPVQHARGEGACVGCRLSIVESGDLGLIEGGAPERDVV